MNTNQKNIQALKDIDLLSNYIREYFYSEDSKSTTADMIFGDKVLTKMDDLKNLINNN